MDKRTFTDSVKACGYEPRVGRDGNITATKGDAWYRSQTTACTSARQS